MIFGNFRYLGQYVKLDVAEAIMRGIRAGIDLAVFVAFGEPDPSISVNGLDFDTRQAVRDVV